MSIDRHEKKLMVLVSIVAAAFAVGLCWPQQQKVGAMQARIAQAEQQLEEARQLSLAANGVARQVQVLEARVASAPKKLPPGAEPAGLHRAVSELADQEQLADAETVTRPLVAGKDYSVNSLSLNFKGSFAATYAFLQGLDHLSRPVWVDQLHIRRVQIGSNELAVSAEVSAFAPSRGGQGHE